MQMKPGNKSPHLKFFFCFICAFIYVFILPENLSASTIILKNDKVIEGDITFEDENKVVVLEYVTNYSYILKRSEIKDIKYEKRVKRKPVTEKGMDTFMDIFQPKLSLCPGFSMPIGDIAAVLSPGYGASLLMDIRIPLTRLERKGFYLRANISTKILYFFSKDPDVDANVLLIPNLLGAEISYNLKYGFRPFFSLGAGFSFAILSGESPKTGAVQKSSFDGSIMPRLGIGYTNQSIPRIELLLDFGYLLVFEKQSGSFINFSFGISYRFYNVSPEPEDEMKLVPGEKK